jgi:hypothetical protein
MTKQNVSDDSSKTPQADEAVSTVTSRRRVLIGAAAPVILSVLSKPAFGAVGARCTISGFTSVNPSGVRHETTGCQGLSPGAWKNPYAGNGDGSLAQWAVAGDNFVGAPFYPNPSDGSGGNDGSGGDPGGGVNGNGGSSSTEPGTLFSALFTRLGGNSNTQYYTLHDMLNGEGTNLQKYAVEALINAAYFKWGMPGPEQAKIHPADVIGLFDTPVGGTYNSAVSSFSLIRPSHAEVLDFFKNLIH